MARKTHSGEDLFLAGLRLGWIPIGFSLFASNISSTTLAGLSGAACIWGIAVSNYEWMAAFVLVFFAIFFIPYYLNARITTVPEFLEWRFDRQSRLYFSALTLFSNVVVDTAGTLFAGAMVLKVFFPEIDLFTACLGLAMVAGLAAVVYTDVLQAGAISPLIDNFPGLFHYLQSALAYLVQPVVVIFVMGLFLQRAGATGALVTLVGGHGVSAILFTAALLDKQSIHFTIVAGIVMLVSAFIFIITSLISTRLHKTRSNVLPSTSLPRNDRQCLPGGRIIACTVWFLYC